MNRKKGFTLIELLAVIVILGIILSISIISVNKIRKKQEVRNRLNNVSLILTGAKKYISNHPEFWTTTIICDNKKCEEDNWFKTHSLYPIVEINAKTIPGKYIMIDDILNDDSIDIDLTKYPELFYFNVDGTVDKNKDTKGHRSLYVSKCDINPLKYQISFKYYYADKNDSENGKSAWLTDCGCEEQSSNERAYDFCSLGNPNSGWDLDGNYYENGKRNEDKGLDIKEIKKQK